VLADGCLVAALRGLLLVHGAIVPVGPCPNPRPAQFKIRDPARASDLPLPQAANTPPRGQQLPGHGMRSMLESSKVDGPADQPGPRHAEKPGNLTARRLGDPVRTLHDVTPGDEFALSISGPDGGVRALGIVTKPLICDTDPDPFWVDAADGTKPDWRIGIRISRRLSSPIRRANLRADPRLWHVADPAHAGRRQPVPGYVGRVAGHQVRYRGLLDHRPAQRRSANRRPARILRHDRRRLAAVVTGGRRPLSAASFGAYLARQAARRCVRLRVTAQCKSESQSVSPAHGTWSW
jgi:hypothetical protein